MGGGLSREQTTCWGGVGEGYEGGTAEVLGICSFCRKMAREGMMDG